MSTMVVEMSGDEAKLLRSFQKLVEKQAEIEARLQGIGDAGEKAGDKVGDGLEGAAQKSSKEFDEVTRSLRKMGPEGRKVAMEVESHLRDTGKGGRESMDSVIARLREIDPEAAQAAEAMRKHMAEQAEVVEAKLIKLPTTFDKIKKSAADAFGASGLSSLSTYAAGLGGITAAVTVLSDGFELMKQKQEAALQSLQAQADPEKRLAQIANSGEDLDQMIAKADQLSLQYGMDRSQSRNLMFSARSEGFAGDVDQIARFGQVVDVGSQGALAGSLGRLFKSEGLNVEQRLSGVLAAASSSAFDFETVGASVKKSAAASTDSGSDLAETLASNATLANLIGETAGDRISTFASKVALDKDLKGKGMLNAALELQAGPAERREKFLGDSKELNEAYTLITENAGSIRDMTESVRSDIAATAEGRGMLRKQTEVVENSERFEQRLAVRRSEVAKELAEEDRYSGDAAEITVAQNNLDADLADRGVSDTNQALLNKPASSLPLIGGLLPDMSAADVAVYGGRRVGIGPKTTATALGSVMSSYDPMASDSWSEFALKLGANADPTGISRGMLQTADTLTTEDVTGRINRRLEQQVAPNPQTNAAAPRAPAPGNPGNAGGPPSASSDEATAIRQQNELQQQSLAAMQQIASNTAPENQPTAPPVNYSSGLQSGATAAAMP